MRNQGGSAPPKQPLWEIRIVAWAEAQVRAVVVVALQESLHQPLAEWEVLRAIVCPAQALFPYRPVEALNVSLLVLLVWPGNPMSLAVGQHPLCKGLIELTTPVCLDQSHCSIEAACHRLIKECTPIGSAESRRHQDVRFLGVDVDAGECKQPSKHDGVHLHYLARAASGRHRPTAMVLLPLGADYVLLPKNLIYLGHRQMHPVFPFQEVGYLLPTASRLSLSDGPYPAPHQRGHLPF